MKKLSLVLALALILMSLGITAPEAHAEETLVIYNAYDYIDEEILEQFTAETGIKIKYTMFTTIEEMYVKLTAGGSSYDIICPSDYMIERLIKEDLLAEIDYSKVPNAQGIADWLWDADFDEGLAHGVPYMWGTVGILYNEDYVDEEITSWSSLFDPSYRKDVFMLDSMRESIGLALKYLGFSMNDHTDEALTAARDLLIKQKDDGIVQGYLVDEVKDKMVAGEAAMAVMWSGDAMYAMMENDSLKYVVPEEGSNIWVDCMCITKSSEHYDAALQFINFLCRPDIALRNYEYIHYASPIESIYDEVDPEEVANPAVNPSREIIDRCEYFHDIMDYIDTFNKYWMEIRA